MKKSISKNYIYNVIYQLFVLLIPIITTPYLSRILGADGIGKYSFTYSIANYFTLVAALGFGYYAQREIAGKQGCQKDQSIIFWEILIVRFFSVSISLVIYSSLGLLGVYKEYTTLCWWWAIQIGAQEIDITFLFQGDEEFGKIVIRNIAAKLISLILIFTLIRTSDQVWLYILCFTGSTVVGNLSLWLYLPKYICKVDIHELHPIRHIKPTIKLFIPTIATSIYTILDKTLIGLLITDTYTVQEVQLINGVETTVDVTKRYSDLQNGYYEQAEKLVKMSMTILTSLGTVMIPRNSKEFSTGNIEILKANVYKSTNFVWFLGVPMTLGLAAIAPNVIPWFLGQGFQQSIVLMECFSPLVLIIGFSNVFGLQYLIPTKQDKKYTIGILAGTISNIILNLLLIPKYWAFGAVIGSIIAEIFVTATMYIQVRKDFSIKKILGQSWKYLIAGGLMFSAVYITQKYLQPRLLNSVILVLEGIIIYTIVLVVLKDYFLNAIFKKIFSSVHKIRK